MRLNGTEYGHIWGGSSVQGFFGLGDEYWRDRLPWPLRPNFEGMTFVAKTTTLNTREGNMPLNNKQQPLQLFPPCIKISWRHGAVLNAVGLSGPGARRLLDKGLYKEELWGRRTKPFILSFMSVAASRDERLMELSDFVKLLKMCLPDFNAPVALQINFSCPNAGLDTSTLVDEVSDALECAGQLGIPLVPKFSVTQVSPEMGVQIAKHQHCAGLCVSNTIPWKDLPENVQKDTFGSTTSPLAAYGGGGYSGPYALELVYDWVLKAKLTGISKPINAGGGILSIDNAQQLMLAGADSIFIASVAMLRPWRVAGIIKFVNSYYELERMMPSMKDIMKQMKGN